MMRKVGRHILSFVERLRGKEYYRTTSAAIYMEQLHPGKNGKERLREFYEKKYGTAAAVLLVGLLVSAVLFAAQWNRNIDNNAISRNDYGSGEKEVTLEATTQDGAAYEIVMHLRSREYSLEEAEEALEQTVKYLDRTIPGINDSLQCVREDILLPDSYGAVSIQWNTDNIRIIDSEGHVFNQDITDEYEQVSIMGTLSCREIELEYRKTVKVYPPLLTEDELLEKSIKTEADQAEESSRETGQVVLPDTVLDQDISWSYSRDRSLLFIPVLFILLSLLCFWNEDQKLHAKANARYRQMESDYGMILSKMVLFLGAGMTIRSAWERIIRDHKSESAEQHYAYDEMAICLNEIRCGIPEAEAYEHFGRRCGNPCYMKFAALLSQNLRKGSKGLMQVLYRESEDAFIRQKNNARVKGEEAGTKLLLPMFLMLSVVLVIIMVPAFMSIQL